MEIIKTTIDKIEKFRMDYLNSLPQFQELFIELMVSDSDCFILKTNNTVVAYAIRNNHGVLIEFYVINKYIPKSNLFFKPMLNDLSIQNIYCKSFDSFLLDNCLASSFSYSLLGVLYRDFAGAQIEKDLEITWHKADHSSIRFLQNQDNSIKELFETEEQLAYFVQNENVFLFYKKNVFVGCGMVLRTKCNWNYCDLGVWVEPSKRGNNTGAQIILNLREFAIGENMTPSCGCSIDNIASQKTIEKSGFVSKYKLINFKTK